MSTVFIRFPAPPGDLLESLDRGEAAPQRSALLERLLARADRADHDDWRRAAYRVVATGPEDPPAVGAAALHAALGAGAADSAGVGSGASAHRHAYAFVASPVHCVATMATVRLPQGGVLRLDAAEAAALAADFNRVFVEGGQRLLAAPDGSMCCVFDRPLAATTVDPLEAVGSDIHGFLPSGADGPMLRRFMSEIEMWLFEHPLNQRRTAAGAPPVTGLWLWGGGSMISRLPTLRGAIAGWDPLFAAWPELALAPGWSGIRAAASAVVVIADSPGSEAWRAVEVAWILPALAWLRSGGLESLDLSAGGRRYHLSARWRRRLWRRTRPWWEFFV